MLSGKSVGARFLWVYIPVGLLIFAVSFGLIRHETDNHAERLRVMEQSLVQAEVRVLLNEFEQLETEVLFLSEVVGNHLGHASCGDDISKVLGELAEDFSALARHSRDFDQVRFIDGSGKEVIRIDFRNGVAEAVPRSRLQDKSGRNYFRKGLEVGGGYVSRFDLNMEGGEIERPLKPMLRFTAGVDGADGERIGVVVLNYLGEKILSRLRDVASASEGQIFLINSGGYWLIGPSRDVEWGFQLPGLENETFQASYPAEWEAVRNEEAGQLETDDGLFTFATLDVAPLVEDLGGEAAESWKIVARISRDQLSPSWEPSAWVALFTALVVLALGTYAAASAGAARDASRRELREAEERFRTMVGNVPGVVYRCDLDEHWTMRFISRDVEELTGRPPEDFINNNKLAYVDVIHPDDVEKVGKVVNEAVDRGAAFTIDYRVVHVDGETRYVYERGLGVRGEDGEVHWLDGVIVDVTDQKKVEQSLKDSESMLRAMSEASHEALVVIRHDDTVMLWNPAAEKMFGYSVEEAIGEPMHELIVGPEDRREANRGLKEFRGTGRGPVVGTMMEMAAVRKNGEVFPVERSVASFKKDGVWYAVGGLRDITERKKAEEKLRELATTDGLTGLNNRRYFMELAGRALAYADRYEERLSGIMFDVDHFKKVNDTYGHDAGDDVLRALSKLALDTFRDVDVVGRLGGEEFGVILPQADRENTVLAAERFRKAVEDAVIPTAAGDLTITISIGAAVKGARVASVEELLKQADQALYEAKNSGRNKVVAWTDEAGGAV